MGGASRLTSLDVFRGLTIAAMIVVNNPGNWNSVYPPLLHVAWHGWTLADLVFPFFIFIMGVAMPLAFARRLNAADRGAALHWHIATRAALLVGLGLLLNLVIVWPHVDRLRLPGVLQRIGLTYLIAATIVLRARPARQMAIAVALLLTHWALLALVPFGGHVTGALTPTDNVASAVDKALFGANTLTPLGDPEGLVGLVSSVATALLGATAGWWIRASASTRSRVFGLIVGGTIAVLVGVAWSYLLPFNKSLWTGSYAMFASGTAALAFATCYLLVDVLGLRRWALPFLWLGANPLTIYFLSELVSHLIQRLGIERDEFIHWLSIKDLIFWQGFARLVGDLGGVRSSLLYAIVYTAFWIGVAGALTRVNRRTPPGASAAARASVPGLDARASAQVESHEPTADRAPRTDSQ